MVASTVHLTGNADDEVRRAMSRLFSDSDNKHCKDRKAMRQAAVSEARKKHAATTKLLATLRRRAMQNYTT